MEEIYLLSLYYAPIIILFFNILSFVLFYIDKKRAIHNKKRISEKTLILSAFLFGSIGAALGMYLLKHKTKNLKFKILIPIFLFLQLYFLFLF